MAEQIGIIVENEANGLARVLTDRRGACGGCHSGPSKCHGCLSTSGKLESHVRPTSIEITCRRNASRPTWIVSEPSNSKKSVPWRTSPQEP